VHEFLSLFVQPIKMAVLGFNFWRSRQLSENTHCYEIIVDVSLFGKFLMFSHKGYAQFLWSHVKKKTKLSVFVTNLRRKKKPSAQQPHMQMHWKFRNSHCGRTVINEDKHTLYKLVDVFKFEKFLVI
jgi:hypothetical protein